MLELQGVRKTYPGTVAVADLSVSFAAGKIHAIVGKNGSGKSTTIKIISGAEYPDAGQVVLNGTPIALGTTDTSIRSGIATVYQELSLFPDLSVAENICFHDLPRRGARIDWAATRAKAQAVLDRLGLTVSPDAAVSTLGVGWQQLIEIAKAINHDLQVLILDEPTSALSQDEVEQLFRTIRTIRDAGVVVLYISHRLQELPEIADTVTVLRDGQHVGTRDMAASSLPEIVEMMFGEVVHERLTPALAEDAPVVLQTHRLSRTPFFENVSFELRAGEILGIAGMLGSGRTELLRSIYGADPVDSGEVLVDGVRVRKATPHLMKQLGLAYTPEDRKFQGLIQIQTIGFNLTLAARERFATRGIRNRAAEQAASAEQVSGLAIKIGTTEQLVSALSGGNQQKVVVGNWLNDQPRIILFDEPSRGIDVEAKQQIFRIMRHLSEQGIASIVVSTELEELIEVCHRILVLRDHALTDELQPTQVSAPDLYRICMGVHT